MIRAEPHRIPPADFRTLVRQGVTPSYNIIIRNPQGATLYVLRQNEPMKGYFWLPGGRLFNGETPEAAIRRIMMEELGLTDDHYVIDHISDRFNSEIFQAGEMDAIELEQRYGPGIQHVHYWASVAVVHITEAATAHISLDEQSGGYAWHLTAPHDHPYLAWYIKIAQEAGV